MSLSAFDKKLVDMLSLNEGRKYFMYPDSKGIVTVGIGHALFTSQDAVALPFVLRSTETRATPSQKILGWSTVRYQSKDNPVPEFRAIQLTDDAIDWLLMSDLASRTDQLRREFPDFESYPEGARLAMYDICYNTGSIRTGFPSMTKAILAKDWHAAAEECWRRPPVGQSRNESTRDLFLACVNA